MNRNTFFKNAAMLCVLILVSIGCGDSSAQSANQDGSRLVGTWVEVESYGDDGNVVHDGSIWVFNSDGTGSLAGGKRFKFKYATIAGKIKTRGCSVSSDGSCGDSWSHNYDFVISNDGKTLFMGDYWLRRSSGK